MPGFLLLHASRRGGSICRNAWQITEVVMRIRPISRCVLLYAIALAGLAAPLGAAAQTAGRTITIVVPFTPGTGPDILARTIGEEIQRRWNQPVIVDNKPGASGN